MTKGFAPSYVFDSGIGKQIAQLKGLEEGFLYPTFAFYYVRNPAPLLLFDEIMIDEEAAKKATDYLRDNQIQNRGYEGAVLDRSRPTQSEVEIFGQLIDSKIFRKVRIAEMITPDDFKRIETAYKQDLGRERGASPEEFKAAVDVMINRYGRRYANPDPYSFEAMNINVTQVLLEKLSAAPLDDVLRAPLYEYKMLNNIRRGMKEVETADEIIRRAREVLLLPTTRLVNIDGFLQLHKDPRVQSFRNKISELSKIGATPQEIAKNIHDSYDDLQKLETGFGSLVTTFLGLAGGLTSLVWGTSLSSFGTGLLGTFGSLAALGNIVQKMMKTKKYEWLDIVKGLCEIHGEPMR